MFSFPNWDVYEHCRAKAGDYGGCKTASKILEESKCFTSYERNFMNPIF